MIFTTKEQSIWESGGLVIFYQSNARYFFGKAGIILWQGGEISFAKQEDFSGKAGDFFEKGDFFGKDFCT